MFLHPVVRSPHYASVARARQRDAGNAKVSRPQAGSVRGRVGPGIRGLSAPCRVRHDRCSPHSGHTRRPPRRSGAQTGAVPVGGCGTRRPLWPRCSCPTTGPTSGTPPAPRPPGPGPATRPGPAPRPCPATRATHRRSPRPKPPAQAARPGEHRARDAPDRGQPARTRRPAPRRRRTAYDPASHTGCVDTFYDADGSGACPHDPSSDVMTGATNHTDYETAKACGAYALVSAADGASAMVRITNECPGRTRSHRSQRPGVRETRRALGRPDPDHMEPGRHRHGGHDLDPLQTGSTRHWCGIQVMGHPNPPAPLEVRAGSGGRQLPRRPADPGPVRPALTGPGAGRPVSARPVRPTRGHRPASRRR